MELPKQLCHAASATTQALNFEGAWNEGQHGFIYMRMDMLSGLGS